MLTGGSRTALPRQQTLRALIDWSYGLLSAAERVLLRRLSVFAGGWTFDAAESVWAGAGIDSSEILDLLTHLVEKSLAVADEGAGDVRYRLLETVRQYARDKLLEAGEGDWARTQHLRYVRAIAEDFAVNYVGKRQAVVLRKIYAELENIRAAIQWSLESSDTPSGMRLCGALIWFWFLHHPAEGLAHVTEILSRPEAAGRSAARASALCCKGTLLLTQNNIAASQSALEEALPIAKETGDDRVIYDCLQRLGEVAQGQGDLTTAGKYCIEALERARQQQDLWQIGGALLFLGDLALIQDQFEEAQALFEESASMLRELGERVVLAVPLRRLGQLAVRRRESEQAIGFIRESVALNIETRDQRGIAASLTTWGALLAADDKNLEAAQMCGAIDAMLKSMNSEMRPLDRGLYEHTLTAIRAQLDWAAFDTAWAEGHALTSEQAVALALEKLHR